MKLTKTKKGYVFDGEADMILSHKQCPGFSFKNNELIGIGSVEIKGFENVTLLNFYAQSIPKKFVERLRLLKSVIRYIFCRKS